MRGLLQAVGHRGERGISMTIRHYERSYTTARSVLGFLEVVGWITVAIGVLAALIGFGTGGLLGAMYRDSPFSARLISAIPGVITFVGGLFSVCYVQVSRAHVDTAEMTREMLLLARKESGGSSGEHSQKDNVSESPKVEYKKDKLIDNKYKKLNSKQIDIVIQLNADGISDVYSGKIIMHREVRIIFNGKEHRTAGRKFATISEAKEFIDDELML